MNIRSAPLRNRSVRELVARAGFEPTVPGYEPGVLPLHHPAFRSGPRRGRMNNHLRLSDGWSILNLRKQYVSSLVNPSHISNTFFTKPFRHGLTRQGQKIRTAKLGLRAGKVALYPELGLLASCQPHKQARAKGKQALINTTRHGLEGSIILSFKHEDQNQLTGCGNETLLSRKIIR